MMLYLPIVDPRRNQICVFIQALSEEIYCMTCSLGHVKDRGCVGQLRLGERISFYSCPEFRLYRKVNPVFSYIDNKKSCYLRLLLLLTAWKRTRDKIAIFLMMAGYSIWKGLCHPHLLLLLVSLLEVVFELLLVVLLHDILHNDVR
ncbi:hypothetical protein BDB01DRAFT_897254 [Pilobolus umbonatus]|nr:hypothetical protein BDB01DRAFT_897254 [Pilobolus umbonatus]